MKVDRHLGKLKSHLFQRERSLKRLFDKPCLKALPKNGYKQDIKLENKLFYINIK